MSSKGRAASGYKPDTKGFYATNAPTTRAVLPYLGIQPGMRILEPMCGKGAIAKVLREHFGDKIRIEGIEIDKKRAKVASKARVMTRPSEFTSGGGLSLPVFDVVHETDLLQVNPAEMGYFDQNITNPFFAIWVPCADMCFQLAPVTTLLLPLGAKSSAERAAWWDKHPAFEYTLRSRPSFAQSVKCINYNAKQGIDRCSYQEVIELDAKPKRECPLCSARTTITRSDSTDYGWFRWAPDITEGRWKGIDTPRDEPAKKEPT